MLQRYVATIQVLVIADSEAEASDGFSELLSHNNFVHDWGYLRLGGQQCSPTSRFITENYTEGDFLT